MSRILEILQEYKLTRTCSNVDDINLVIAKHDEIFKPTFPTDKTCPSCLGRAFQNMLFNYKEEEEQILTSKQKRNGRKKTK